MRVTFTILGALLAALAARPALAQDTPPRVWSGPQAGEKLTPFKILGAYGDFENRELNPLELAGGQPVLWVYVNGANRPAAALTRALIGSTAPQDSAPEILNRMEAYCRQQSGLRPQLAEAAVVVGQLGLAPEPAAARLQAWGRESPKPPPRRMARMKRAANQSPPQSRPDSKHPKTVQPKSEPATWHAEGRHGAIAAGGREAADAGLAVLQNGGNAVDAAVVALLVLNVTDSKNYCFGGEVPILVYHAPRKVVEVVCGIGAAPRLATLEHFQNLGGIPEGGHPQTALVPGSLDALLTALERYGTLTFTEAARPMLEILDRHEQDWHANFAHTIRRLVAAEQSVPGDRARGLRQVRDYFYRGPLAREMDAWSRAHDGLLRYSDFATHTTRIEDPVASGYRSYTIAKCGPWTQGPYLLATLNLLEGFDLRALGHNQPDYIHLLLEAMKLGLADRDTFLADPHFVPVPVEELIAKNYAKVRRPLIDMTRASVQQRPGDPLRQQPLLIAEPRHYQSPVPTAPVQDTTTCVVADRWGNVVAATPSGWGGVTNLEAGIVFGSRMRSFNTWPGHPNCVAPGKRPRTTLTPTLVLKQGRPVFAVSVAGGDWQDQVGLQVLLNMIEFGMTPAEAVTTDRFGTHLLVGSFNQPPPDPAKISIYETVGKSTLEALEQRGHKIKIKKPPFWHPVALAIDPETGLIRAAGDPAAKRHAAGY